MNALRRWLGEEGSHPEAVAALPAMDLFDIPNFGWAAAIDCDLWLSENGLVNEDLHRWVQKRAERQPGIDSKGTRWATDDDE